MAAAIVFAAAASASGGSGSSLSWSGPGADAPSDDDAFAVAVQPDGRAVVGGESEPDGGLALARYTRAGRLDPGFGAGGKVVLSMELSREGGAYRAEGVAFQADGKIVVADSSDGVLVRFTSAGRLDPSFGRGGWAIGDLGEECGGWPHALALQGDGKVVVAGECSSDMGGFMVARYTTDGHLDTSFGSGGHLRTDFGGRYAEARAVAIQTDGRIVAAGSAAATNEASDVAIARFTPGGRLDASFGSGGEVLTDLGGADGASGVALQADGKIVIGGGHGLVRYNPDGTLDPSFGRGGSLISDVDIRGVALQGDGKIVVVGGRAGHLALARYAPDGRLDASFNSPLGTTRVEFSRERTDSATAVALQPDGKILAAGTSAVSADFYDFALARLDQRGRLDRSFGTGGKVLTNFGCDVMSLSATRMPTGVLVRWRTGAEVNTHGFHVYRVSNGHRVRVSSKLILRRGSGTRGASYSFLDRGAPAATRRYWLQEIKRYPAAAPPRGWFGPAVVG